MESALEPRAETASAKQHVCQQGVWLKGKGMTCWREETRLVGLDVILANKRSGSFSWGRISRLSQ